MSLSVRGCVCAFVSLYIFTHRAPSPGPSAQPFYSFPYIHIAPKSVVNNWTKILRCPYMILPTVSFVNFSPYLITTHYHLKVSGSWKFLLPTVSRFVGIILVFPPLKADLLFPPQESHTSVWIGTIWMVLYKYTHSHKNSSSVFFLLFSVISLSSSLGSEKPLICFC